MFRELTGLCQSLLQWLSIVSGFKKDKSDSKKIVENRGFMRFLRGEKVCDTNFGLILQFQYRSVCLLLLYKAWYISVKDSAWMRRVRRPDLLMEKKN